MALKRKHIPAPNFISIIPDKAGPTNLATLLIEEFRASALGRSALSFTSSFTSGCLAGTSNALITPSRRLVKVFPKQYSSL